MFDQQITFLYTRDPEVSRRFYEGALELDCVLVQDGGCRIYRTGPASFVGLCAAREGRSANPTGVILCLVTQDVEGWGARLKAKGVRLEKAAQTNPDFAITHLFLRDPDGYLIEIQRFEDPAWPAV